MRASVLGLWVVVAACTACGSSGGGTGASGGAGGAGTGGAGGLAGAGGAGTGGAGTGGAAGGGTGGAAGTGTGGVAGSAPSFRVALSVSPFTGTLFAAGAAFSDGTTTAKDATALEQLYVSHGANEVFARISGEKDPTGSPDDHSLATALTLAKLAKGLGLPFNPELGLWKHYGDITCQPPPDFSDYPSLVVPGAWGTLSVDQMVPVFHDYGALVASAIVQTGVDVDVWDLGNEIDFGVAGVAPQGISGSCSTPYAAPDGVDPAIGQQTVLGLLTMSETSRIAWLGAHVWPAEAKILGAVAAGIKSVVPTAHFATHMSQSHSPTFAEAFYQAMFDGGFAPDVIGFSFYPSALAESGKVQGFRDTVDAVHTKFQRPVFVAEFAYPAGPTATGPYAGWTHAVPSYPLSEDGQAALLRDLSSWAVASGLAGIRPWAPEVYISGWEGFALFQGTTGGPAQSRKALDSIAQGAASPDATAFHD